MIKRSFDIFVSAIAILLFSPFFLLCAAAVLDARGRDDIRIVLVGEGSQKARLTRRARDQQLDAVLFLDPMPKVSLAGLLAGADLGLQTLRNLPAFYFGTSPNKFFDYIAAGLPVLNNYPGWLAELISETDCGFVVPPDDASAFADALIAASEDRKALIHKGNNSLLLAQSRFNRLRISSQWVDWVVGAGGEK